MARHAKKDIERTVSRFFAVRRVIRTTLAQGRKLHPSAWLRIETLKFIADCGEPAMREVADHLSITAPSATSLIRGLMKDGLVSRIADARDRRVQRLRLTRKGKTALARTIARGTELLGALFAPLSRAELAAFARALERLQTGA